ncbi:MAG: hypothetical protein UR27_C0021G0034 [Candidatus Peregrinibacteria bacterium GW2011_GWA2_33_10]|nr:MAG: hypothetical protein UR27_C0021G0034 [Candidatus Peregrinibacteria bacterium GW2011_GWA2_33_10]KKP40983.1 MAG: ABC transporter-like protein, macrolide transport system ATP-binding/permease protein [Candidatus Peregrinibacteria bacterium GW2011_GWC2_33_13]OGJ48748.1 MAG: hypothetical protein A2229_01025 [Candidatus Peregrinibacteria bacterium RIFOXYA2_FULL_33_7]
MRFRRILKIAINSLKLNKLRSWLTTIGIIIGISTVVIALSVGESAQNAVSKQLLAFGGSNIFAEISVPNSSHATSGIDMAAGVQITSMKESDLEAFKQLPNVKNGYAAIMSPEKVSFGNTTARSIIWATNQSYPQVENISVTKGRFFSLGEEKGLARVAVLGPKLAEDLFGDSDPIDQTIRIKQINFKVIGVLTERGTSFAFDLDDMAYIPLKTAQKQIMGMDYVTYISVSIENQNLAKQTAEDMRVLLRKRHGIPMDDPDKDDFQVTTMDDAMEMTQSIIGGVSLLLTAIAIISLIVGGVGIMNIMYVSVSERTREIGLRKAIGARGDDILWQFLLEAIAVTLAGGIIGVLGALIIIFLASLGANHYGLDWEMIISIKSIILAIGASSVIGIVFGIQPARKAAKLEAIVALTRE